MARVTEKYASDPIEQAKAQALAEYSAKKTSSVPTEIVDLPSEGRFYPKNHPLRSGKIEMRYMTAYDEDILTNASYIRNGVAIDKLLETLIVNENIKYDSILQCDKDALILAARILSYGKTYNVVVTHNEKEYKHSVDLTSFDFTSSDLTPDENGYCEYEINSVKFVFKLLSVKENMDMKESEHPKFDFLLNSIVKINDISSKEAIREYLQYSLLARDSKQLREYIINNIPRVDLTIELEDEDGGVFTSGFPIRSDFFYP
jgi:hypothetical protein